ncbi:MAG: hypothetical protein O9276_10275 [Microcystis sp. LE17-20A]|uniref:hypothetical protein n=1 Tax=unclassified Microcystis TaxID=2643300 RepID=UPI0022BD0C73|nr:MULTISPECIES: hypothetical protein [unclassified Microcystis]MCZ8038497.1 hypothetical protein [Microcystis sp. LE17-20A]MCZ8210537.1 hypothetical protein [Microcystis sp. LE19-8.1F]
MNDDFLVSLGLELCQEFQEWNYSLIDDWLNSIELLEKDLQPIARLHLAIEDLSEITDLCRDWEAWLTADFVPSLRSKNGKMSSLERDSSQFDLGVNTSSFMSFSRQSLASASDYPQPNPRVRNKNYPPLQEEQENLYNIRQKKQISFDDNHQANNIYPQNNATKSQRELTNLVRDISAENLPVDSDNLNLETTPWQNSGQKTEIESNNPSPKNWQELTDLVRDISGGNLPLDSDNLNLETTPWQNSGQKTEIESNNPSPKNWQELTDLVRDISGDNLPLDSATAADIISQSAEMLPISSQVLQPSREKLYHQINNINSNFSNIKETELEINKQESENQSFNQHTSLQDTEQQAIDLDYILETLQTKINQEYRRFYGG